MENKSVHQCYGCKAVFPIQNGLDQCAGIGRYGVAIPECLAAFYDIIARECELFGYPPAHRLIIDAYAVQHPRRAEWQKKLNIEPRLIQASIQSIGIHLIALYCAIELKMELSSIAKVMNSILANMGENKFEFSDLTAPEELGSIKVADVRAAFFAKECSIEEYTQLARQWAQVAWDAWKDHHDLIRTLHKKYGDKNQ